MILDQHLVMSNAQAVTTGATASTDYIDLGVARDIAPGTPLEVFACVTTTATSGGSATLAFKVETDDNTSFSSATTLISKTAVAVASLVAGLVICKEKLPSTTERYVRCVWTVATADLTAGNFTAALVKDVERSSFYPTSYTI